MTNRSICLAGPTFISLLLEILACLYLVGRHDLFILRFHLVALSAPAVDIGLLTMIALVLIWKNSSQPAILFPN